MTFVGQVKPASIVSPKEILIDPRLPTTRFPKIDTMFMPCKEKHCEEPRYCLNCATISRRLVCKKLPKSFDFDSATKRASIVDHVDQCLRPQASCLAQTPIMIPQIFSGSSGRGEYRSSCVSWEGGRRGPCGRRRDGRS